MNLNICDLLIPYMNFMLDVCAWGVCDIQGVSRLVDITAGGDFLGLCDQKMFT